MYLAAAHQLKAEVLTIDGPLSRASISGIVIHNVRVPMASTVLQQVNEASKLARDGSSVRIVVYRLWRQP